MKAGIRDHRRGGWTGCLPCRQSISRVGATSGRTGEIGLGMVARSGALQRGAGKAGRDVLTAPLLHATKGIGSISPRRCGERSKWTVFKKWVGATDRADKRRSRSAHPSGGSCPFFGRRQIGLTDISTPVGRPAGVHTSIPTVEARPGAVGGPPRHHAFTPVEATSSASSGRQEPQFVPARKAAPIASTSGQLPLSIAAVIVFTPTSKQAQITRPGSG